MGTVQISRIKIGLGLIVSCLLVLSSVQSKEIKDSSNFYLTIHAPYPVDIGSVEVAKQLAALHCPDLLIDSVNKRLVADIHPIELFEQLQEGSQFETTFIIKKQNINCKNFYLEEKVDFAGIWEQATKKFSNSDPDFIGKNLLPLSLSNSKISNENSSVRKIKLENKDEGKHLSFHKSRKEHGPRIEKTYDKNLSDERTPVTNLSKVEDIEGKRYGLKFNLYSGEY